MQWLIDAKAALLKILPQRLVSGEDRVLLQAAWLVAVAALVLGLLWVGLGQLIGAGLIWLSGVVTVVAVAKTWERDGEPKADPEPRPAPGREGEQPAERE